MEKESVKLHIVGITFNQIENGMYALVLEEEEGEMRLPIIIGYNEAQSIECILQKITTPRPLTHELTAEILKSFGIDIQSVMIKHLPNGIFAADMILSNGSDTHIVDARSSDAIALAIRMNAPIFTTREILQQCGISKDSFSPSKSHMISNKSIPDSSSASKKKNTDQTAGDISIEQLQKQLQKAVEAEEYEKAEKLKNEIEKRTTNNTTQQS